MVSILIFALSAEKGVAQIMIGSLVAVLFLTRAVLGDFEWCIAPSTVHVLQNETCKSLETIITKEFDVYGMQGEEESQQLLIETRGWGTERNMTSNVTLSFDTFMDTNGVDPVRDNPIISWWQVGYVYCKPTTRYPGSGGGWRPDPLLSPSNGGVVLESEITQPLWISVKIPNNFPPGTYNSSVTVEMSGKEGAAERITIPVMLTVWKIQLPLLSKSKFPAIFSFNKNALNPVYGNNVTDIAKKFEDLLIDQRMGGNNLYTTVPTDLTEAKYLANAGVQWISLFDVYGASSNSRELQHAMTDVRGACLNFTNDLIQKVIQILTPSITSAQQMNILDKMFVYGFDEAPAICEESIRNLYSALKQKWKNIRTVATVNWLPDTSIPLDVWVLQYEEYNQQEASKWMQSGKQQWWYHCIEPSGIQFLNTFIERPQLQTRLLFWLASAHEVSGWLYYSVVMWNRYPKSSQVMHQLDGTARTDFDPANYIWYPRTDIFANGDGNFLYPGEDGPIATVRLHNLRDGFEDAEMFQQIPIEKRNNFTNPLVRSATDYTLDHKLFASQREKAANEIMENNNVHK